MKGGTIVSQGRIFFLNGPNLNLLGAREPEIYGRETLADIEAMVRARAAERNVEIEFRQSNHEGVLIDWTHEARADASALVINAGAYTHTSIALHDALKAVSAPIIELHLSNIHAREAFRSKSYVGMASDGVICGFGAQGYAMALDAAIHLAEKRGNK